MTSALRVLLIDDDDVDAELLAENLALGVSGLVVTFARARTGAEALALLTSSAFDLCLLDYRLGRESGLDVLAAIRARNQDLPIVMLTSAPAHEVDVAASEVGADDYLDKVGLEPRMLEHAVRYARSHRRLARELRAQNREKNLLLGMAAHDLRNPIGVVRRHAEFLGSHLGELEPKEVLEILETMRSSCAQMSGLIDDLLDVSAIEAGTLVLRRRPADLGALVRDVVAQHQTVADRKKIVLAARIDALPPVAFDRDRLEQVLANLVGNAIKYSNAGGRVEVRVDATPEAGVRIAVEDGGIGIAPEFLPRLFRPFQHERRSGTSGEKSTGLGLAIAKRIVEAHGGCIDATSKPGEGSTFTIVLPVDPAPSSVAVPSTALSV